MTRPARILRSLARALAFTLAGVAAAGAVIAQGGRFSPWLDLAGHFAPFWLLGALLSGIWAMVGERRAARRILLGIAILAVLAAAALMAPELTRPLAPPAPASAPFRLRLIQFNTWDDLAEPNSVADWIAGERPDVVTVEELRWPLRAALIARGFQYTHGMLDVAIFSRRPRLRAPFPVPGLAWATLPPFARATFAAPDGGPPLTVVAAHLTWPIYADRWRQRATLPALTDRYPRDRLIVAGDFNLTPWSFALQGLDRRLGLERRDRDIPTWPARHPLGARIVATPAFLPIDHVYAGSAWRTVSVRRGPRLGSDHYPLVVDLALEGPAPRLPGRGPPAKTGSRAGGVAPIGQW